MYFPLSSRVFPITVPPLRDLEGTHGDRVAGDNTQHSHKWVSSTCYATALCAPASQQHGAVACTVRQARRSLGSPPCGSCSVFEVAYFVNKCALNECSFIRKPNSVWISPHQVRYHRACTISSRSDITATKLQYHYPQRQYHAHFTFFVLQLRTARFLPPPMH